MDDMISGKWPLLVYLDQNGWIDLAKIVHRVEKTEDESKLINAINLAVKEGRALFPLSIVNLDETNKISSVKRKQHLLSLMVKLSKGYSISPYIDNHIAVEVDQYIEERLGSPRIDLRYVFIKRGIHHLIGSKPKIVSKDGDITKTPPPNVVEKMTSILYDPRFYELSFMKSKPDSSFRSKLSFAAAEMEKIRRGLLDIKDSNLRRRVFLVQNIAANIIPHFADISTEKKLPRDFLFREDMTREEFEKILERIPTGLTLIYLMMYRDLQFHRPIFVNDIYDVWGLTLSIPYCNVVVTEKMWVSIARQSKLDKICKTDMLSSIRDLIRYI
ncbi:MAG: hypothetical protein NWE88_09860 [Candidatus Bathyarchaeota archaeon]|nr:hypothetical protein [Candidatus Bathyarchaeota archaeon]